MAEQPLMYRQGDVFLRAVLSIPANAQPVMRDAGRIILAYGEATGHAHAIDAPESEATLLSVSENERFLHLVSAVDLVHEEHSTIHLPAGSYAVVRQRVWTDAQADEEEQWRYAGD
jgi:hypothetical protein